MDPREEDDFEDVSYVMHPSSSAKILGKITKLSPMMQGRRSKYFRGKISGHNGKPKQLFGFGDELHKQLHKCQESRKTVMLSNCGVQPIPNSEDMEIKVNELTNVRESSVAVEAVQTNVTKLDQLSTLKVYDPITVVVEALNVGDPEQTQDGNYVQNISIFDETGSCRLSIWESQIGKIVKGERYHLTNAIVREYNGEMFLSTSKCHPFRVEIIQEAGDVGGDHAVTVCAENVTIIGVKNFENYDTCQECNGEVQCDDDNEELVKCSECQMTQLGSQCKKLLKAELVVVSGKGQKLTLNANGEAIAAIADVSISGDVSKKDVLNAKPFTMSYSARGKEILSVDRK